MAEAIKLRIDNTDSGVKIDTKAKEALGKRIDASVDSAAAEQEKSEAQANAAVEREAQRAIEGIGTLWNRIKGRVVFDQTHRIDEAAKRLVNSHSIWFKTRTAQIKEGFTKEMAQARALQEVRSEIERQINAMQEKQTAAKEGLRLMRSNIRWYNDLFGTQRAKLAWHEHRANKAEKHAGTASEIFAKHTEKLDAKLGNIREIRANFCKATEIDDATLTKLIAGEEITVKGRIETKLHRFIAHQPKELRTRLADMFIALSTGRGKQLNNQLRVDQLLGKAKEREALEVQLKTAEKGTHIALATAKGEEIYEVVSKKENGSLVLVTTETKSTAPIFIWSKEKGLFATTKESNMTYWNTVEAKKASKKAEKELTEFEKNPEYQALATHLKMIEGRITGYTVSKKLSKEQKKAQIQKEEKERSTVLEQMRPYQSRIENYKKQIIQAKEAQLAAEDIWKKAQQAANDNKYKKAA